MSIEGFVRVCNARILVLQSEISDIIKRDHGRHIFKNTRKQREEMATLREKVRLAERRGIGTTGPVYDCDVP